MNKLIVIFLMLCTALQVQGQDKKAPQKEETAKAPLPNLREYMLQVQQDITLFLENLKDHSKESDVMYIVNTTEKYLDSTQNSKALADVLLRKEFMPLRNFFLTVNNKTSVSTSFICADVPFHFCSYNDTAATLYIAAMRNGNTYSAKDRTEKMIASTAFEECVLPAMKALKEFKDNELQYFALSVYYGCKDNKETIPNPPAIRGFCLTFVARFADIRKYTEGFMTAEELVDNSEVYLSGDEAPEDFRRVKIILE